ncbi:MAG: hypothetical protein DK306_000509 [Chloroflexi bacterium]|jgi:hypothetical protein|nr:MAG: hypothetical protein DK306_000509 [Chloroflexota bacterium]
MSLIELNIRGVPDWLLRTYLLELGAAADPHDRDAPRMSGDGYTVSWSSERVDLAGGTLKLTQLNILLDGDQSIIAAFEPELMKKLQRGGG